MMKCKYEGIGIYEGRCWGTKEIDPCPGYDKCSQFKPNFKTNAEHIRSMSDEELAKEAADALSYCAPGSRPSPEGCISSLCVGCWLNWLKKPFEEKYD